MADKKPTNNIPDNQSQSYTQTFSEEELQEIYQSIQDQVARQRDIHSSLATSATPQRRSRTLPILVIVLSALFSLAVLFLFTNSVAGNAFFERLFPTLSTQGLGEPSNVSQNQILKKIRDESAQSAVNLQVQLFNQQSALEFSLQSSENEDEPSPQNNEQIAELEAEIERLTAETNEQIRIVEETIVLPQIDISDYNNLLAEQERFTDLLDNYLLLVGDVNVAIQNNNLPAINRSSTRLQNFLNTFPSSDEELIRLVVESGNNFLLSVNSYVDLANRNTTLSSDTNVSNAQIVDLQTNISDLETNIVDLETEVAGLEAESAELEQSINALNRQLQIREVQGRICETDLTQCKQEL